MREIYLDNSATTRVFPEVIALAKECMEEDFGNAASLHQKGFSAEQRIRKAKEQIAETLKCSPFEIFFTSGGTESNNWAIRGAALARIRSGKHLITTNIEHPSVKMVMNYMEQEGFTVTYLEADENGLVTPEQVLAALREDTTLVSIMAINNEIGSVMPIAEIGKAIHAKNKNIIFHVDAIQAYGKELLYPGKMDIDLMSVSGHKIHSPKGVGFLYVRDGVRLRPLILGGGQQKGMRSGTENVPGSAGLGLAAEKMYRDFDAHIEHLYAIKKLFVEEVSSLPDVRINGKTGRDSAPQIVSVSFKDIRSEVLLHALEEKNIYVSSGSACHSNRPSDVTTLDAIKLPPEYREGTLRFSFSIFTTEEEIRYTIDVLRELLPNLRRFVRK